MTSHDILTRLHTAIQTQIDEDSNAHAVHTIVKELIREKWTGKGLNRRFFTHLLPKLAVLYGTEPIVYHRNDILCSLYIWGGGSPWTYATRLAVYLAPTTPPSNPDYHGHWVGSLNQDGFEHYNQNWGEAAVVRIARAQALLDHPGTLRVISKQCCAMRQLQATLDTRLETCDVYALTATVRTILTDKGGEIMKS